jgi:hypothetical protein
MNPPEQQLPLWNHWPPYPYRPHVPDEEPAWLLLLRLLRDGLILLVMCIVVPIWPALLLLAVWGIFGSR